MERLFTTPSALVNVMVKAVFKATPSLVRDFGEVERLQVSKKGPQDFVSNADRRSEKTIQSVLQKARPDFHLLMEEGGLVEGEGEGEWTWVVDPLDGTLNFLHALPHFCMTIAVLNKGQPFAGIIYDPLRDELFWSERGKGCFLGKYKVATSTRSLGQSVLMTVSQMDAPSALNGKEFQNTSIRHTGSSALDLAYVAAGRFDVMLAKNLKPWDVAAGLLMVEEAGGFTKSTTDAGGVYTSLFASNKQLISLEKVLMDAKPS